METIENKTLVRKTTQRWRANKQTVGFVPTMGALHEGHLQLVRRSMAENDKTVCSIFVNPLQFNSQEDLENYPNTLEKDLELLKKVGCDLVFTPNAELFYEGVKTETYDFGILGKVMEAQHRPGHFEGVVAVVKELFLTLEPHKAYFGEKDYQQLAVIRWLVKVANLPVQIVPCTTVRSTTGLALSSRNLRLSKEGLEQASELFAALNYCRINSTEYQPQTLVERALAKLSDRFEVEYFKIVDEQTFENIGNWEESTCPRAFAVVHLEGVRLIDNLSLNT